MLNYVHGACICQIMLMEHVYVKLCSWRMYISKYVHGACIFQIMFMTHVYGIIFS